MTATLGKFYDAQWPFHLVYRRNLDRDIFFSHGLDTDACSTRSNAGYCFIEFATPEAATKALALTGTPVPNSARVFKLNWASGGGLVDRRYVHNLSE